MLDKIEKVEINSISKKGEFFEIKWGPYSKQPNLSGKEKDFVGEYSYEWYLNVNDAKAKQLMLTEEYINALHKQMINASNIYHSAIIKYTTIINKNI
jgi:hypothetical protein